MEQQQVLEFDLILNQLKNELASLRKNLNYDKATLKRLKKNDLVRAVLNLQTLLIATLESPIEETQEMDEHLKNTLFQKTMGIRQLQTSLTMFAVSDGALGEAERELIAKAEKEANNESQDVEQEKE